MAIGQNAEEFGGVHGLHVLELREAVLPELIGVEKGGEAAVHVEGLVVEPLEDFAVHVGFECIFCVVWSDD